MRNQVLLKWCNANISNLCFFTDSPSVADGLSAIGALYSVKNNYYNQVYKDTDLRVLYDEDYWELPMPLIYKLSEHTPEGRMLREQTRKFVWSKQAKDLYFKAIGITEKIRSIKLGDMDVVWSILGKYGFDNDISFPLKDHQLKALAMHLVYGHSHNWSEMRTGKTPPAILYSHLLLKQGIVEKALYVVLNRNKWNWYDEVLKFTNPVTHKLTTVIDGGKKKKIELWKNGWLIYIVNYESLRADLDIVHEVFDGKKYVLICDEAHSIKNPDSLQTQAVTSLNPSAMVAMTGTPVANRPHDIFEPANMTHPRLLAWSMSHYKNLYAERIGEYGNIQRYRKGALDTLRFRMAHVSFRVLRKDVNMDLGKVIQPISINMSKKQEKLHAQMEEDYRAELLSDNKYTSLFVNNMMVKMMRLQQITGGYLPILEYDDKGKSTVVDYIWLPDKDNQKICYLDEFIDDYLEDIGKLVIFSRFVAVIERLIKRYSQHGALGIYGELKSEQCHANEKLFQTEPKHKIIVVNSMMGVGIDLNPLYDKQYFANTGQFAIFYDRSLYPLENWQSEDRLTGYNQKGELTINPLICRDSIDEVFEYSILPDKLKMFKAVVGDDAGYSDNMKIGITKDDLFKMLRVKL